MATTVLRAASYKGQIKGKEGQIRRTAHGAY